MHVVRHDFHFEDLKVFISCCIPEGRFHNIIHPVDHDPPSVLRAEDYMVFAVINQVCSAIIFCHNSLRNSRFTFHIYYNMTSAIWQGTDKKYTHIFRVLTKTFHCSASICTLKSGSFLARIIVKKQYNNKRKEKRICADKSQYILIRKDCLNILPDKGRKILKKNVKIRHQDQPYLPDSGVLSRLQIPYYHWQLPPQETLLRHI